MIQVYKRMQKMREKYVDTLAVITCYHSCKRTEKDRWLSFLPMENFIEWDKESEDKLYEKLGNWKARILNITNKNVNKSSQVSSVEVMKEPFEKTATQKIRRFKYKESAPTVEEEQRNK